MKLTNKIKKKYLKNPEICPYCNNSITAEGFDAEYNQAWREVSCNSCNKTWREIFTLTDIEEV